jgi:hypothetical protein
MIILFSQYEELLGNIIKLNEYLILTYKFKESEESINFCSSDRKLLEIIINDINEYFETNGGEI